MIYIIKRIDEDLDFGCEERSEDAPVMAVVTLVDSFGKELKVKAEDAMLYARDINEGDKVCFDRENALEKALGEHLALTLDYYNQNAENFIESTQAVDMHPAQDKFLGLLQDGARILDFGCGSGRDTKYFLEKGYQVTATDGSAELCRLASAFTGIEVKEMLFQELNEIKAYDGIWACASILHASKAELLSVLQKMCIALNDNGVIYTSFKYGEFEGERNGRYFTDFTEHGFEEFIADIPEMTIEACWMTGDVRQGRGDEKWLNLILRKSDIR